MHEPMSFCASFVNVLDTQYIVQVGRGASAAHTKHALQIGLSGIDL